MAVLLWTLTDIIIALSLSELLAQGEGSETLEFLREFLGCVGSERPRALPTELVEGVGFTHLVVLPLHHVQHIALSCMRWHLAVGVVGTDDVQIVVDTHFHCVLIPEEAAGRQEERGGYWQMSSPGKMNNNMNNRGGYCPSHTHPDSLAHTAHVLRIITRVNYTQTRAATENRLTRTNNTCKHTGNWVEFRYHMRMLCVGEFHKSVTVMELERAWSGRTCSLCLQTRKHT